MNSTSLKSLVFGFIAGAIAVVTVHELINYILLQAGVFPRVPWSMEPAAMTGVPQIVSDAFWGGLWGSLFVMLAGKLPGGSLLVKGIIFGMVGPAIIGVFILVPLITGRFPLFFDFAPMMLGSVLLILAGWGAATAWLCGMLGARSL